MRKSNSTVPLRLKGGWKDNTTCKCCGWFLVDEKSGKPKKIKYNFCPCCGADARRSQESEDKK
jgi:hypothetical protein